MGSAAQSRSNGDVLYVVQIALAAAVIVVLATTVSRRRGHALSFRTDAGEVRTTASGDLRLSTAGLLFEVVGRAAPGEASGDLRSVRDVHGDVLDNVALGATVDGRPVRIDVDKPRATPEGPMVATAHARLFPASGPLEARIDYTLSRSPPALTISLSWVEKPEHDIGLSLATPVGRRMAFVRGVGLLADATDARGSSVTFEDRDRACALAAPDGDVMIHMAPLAEEVVGLPLVATVTSPEVGQGAARLFVAPAGTLSGVTDAIARMRHDKARRVSGRVAQSAVSGEQNQGVDVWAVGNDGKPILHVRPEADGHFEATAPAAELRWYATTEHTRASPMVSRGPDDEGPLELTLVPGGEVRVRIRDLDTDEPLTSRLIVHGVPPAADPNFGPDYRASGAGPLIDTLRGEATLPLPTGRYRLLATRGPEYTVDEQTIDVGPGSSQTVDLLLRHVIPTPGLVGCDFHVHARPSFDAAVLPEDRVLSLVAAGVDFAVPSEHNRVGNYAPAIEALDLDKQFSSIPGVEITTTAPRYGHFNVFPFSGPKTPPYTKTTLKQIFTKAREGDPTRVLQVNHPRLTHEIGYFDIVGLDTVTGRAERKDYRDDFDTLEVYNGADGANRARVERVLRDWLQLLAGGHRYVATGDSDSHHIQYQWAGYPRTYVALTPEQAGDTGGPVDAKALIVSLKAGHVFVTSGPFIEATIAGTGPGGTVRSPEATVTLHVTVRAAPFVDVDEVEIMLGTTTLRRWPVPARPLVTGRSQGTLEQAERDTVRFERDVEVPVPAAGSFVVVIARGARPLDDVLPHTPIQPLAFTNPIWIGGPAVSPP